jgi:hypothetical protein
MAQGSIISHVAIIWVIPAFGRYKLKLRTGEGNQKGGEWEPIKILVQELAYVPSSNPKPKSCKRVMNTPTNSIEMISSKL